MTLFLEFWKRYQAELEYQWDTVEFLEQEQPARPEYEAKCIYERKNPVTGVNHTLFPANVKQLTFQLPVKQAQHNYGLNADVRLRSSSCVCCLFVFHSGQRKSALYRLWTVRSGVPRDQYSHILGKLSYIYGILIICKLCLHSGHRKMTKNSYIKAIFQASHAVGLPGVSRTSPLKAAIHPGSPSHQAEKCFHKDPR